MSLAVTVGNVDILTRHKYERLQYTGSAGIVAALEDQRLVDRWRGEFPAWTGEHWAFDAGTESPGRLRPINVAAHRRSA
ncbi:hypothetical protein [Nocardia camponoti]|uniref:Uncharacterized protein n=1 Tax=Nocardia camponoti TaxID=1616106 RepID=A0A917QRQ1_9NOCA|nr:hypothetical protein [Nocardia camponoti]GGK65279.1 hypothetical protein GCM10011591_41910 [Nocardia camponoti]